MRDYLPATLSAEIKPLPFVTITSATERDQLGKDMAYFGFADNGLTYWLKDDRRGLMVRATEMFCHGVARLLNFAVPDYAIAQYKGRTYFASRNDGSSAAHSRTDELLGKPRVTAEGAPDPWPGGYLEHAYGLDMMLGNPDRTTTNFLIGREDLRSVLYLLDFADVRLLDLSRTDFPAWESNTRKLWRLHKRIHTLQPKGAMTTVESFGQITRNRVTALLQGIPDEWMPDAFKDQVEALWSGGSIAGRAACLVAGLSDGSLG